MDIPKELSDKLAEAEKSARGLRIMEFDLYKNVLKKETLVFGLGYHAAACGVTVDFVKNTIVMQSDYPEDYLDEGVSKYTLMTLPLETFDKILSTLRNMILKDLDKDVSRIKSAIKTVEDL